MRELQERRRFKKMFYSKTFLTILIVLIVFLIRPVWNAYNKMTYSHESLGDLENRIKELKNREAFLFEEIEKLRTQRGIEEEIRRKFNLAKEGEGVVIITENKEEMQLEKQEEHNFRNYWNKFKSFFIDDVE